VGQGIDIGPGGAAMSELQYRSIGSAISLDGDVTDVDGHYVHVTFPVAIDKHSTVFKSDCFRDSLARNPHVPMVRHHDARDPIGVMVRHQILPDRWECVNRFSSFDAVPSAKRVWHQVADGSCSSFSYAFTDGEHSPHPDPKLRRKVRVYTRATLRETSPVTTGFGSIPGARATGLRSLDYIDPDLDITGALDTLDALCSTGSTYRWLRGEPTDDERDEEAMRELIARSKLDGIALKASLR
jgi:phage head maturation protease